MRRCTRRCKWTCSCGLITDFPIFHLHNYTPVAKLYSREQFGNTCSNNLAQALRPQYSISISIAFGLSNIRQFFCPCLLHVMTRQIAHNHALSRHTVAAVLSVCASVRLSLCHTPTLCQTGL